MPNIDICQSGLSIPFVVVRLLFCCCCCFFSLFIVILFYTFGSKAIKSGAGVFFEYPLNGWSGMTLRDGTPFAGGGVLSR